MGPLLLPREALKNTHITFLRTCRPHRGPAPPPRHHKEGRQRARLGKRKDQPASATGSKQAPANHPRMEGRGGGQAVCSQREQRRVRPKREIAEKRVILLENPILNPPKATGHAPHPVRLLRKQLQEAE